MHIILVDRFKLNEKIRFIMQIKVGVMFNFSPKIRLDVFINVLLTKKTCILKMHMYIVQDTIKQVQ